MTAIREYFDSFTADDWKKAALVGAGVTVTGAVAYYAYQAYQKDDQPQLPSKEKPQAVVAPQAAAKPAAKTDDDQIEKLPPVQQADAYKNKGNNLFKERKFEAAREYYTKAIDVCPPSQKEKLAIYHQNRAATYNTQNDTDKIIFDCTKAIENNVKHKKAYGRRAKAYETKGDYKQALLDLTILCICEQFQNFATLQEADRVLRDAAQIESKQFMQARSDSPVAVSSVFARSYFDSFYNDLMANRAKVVALDKSKTESQYKEENDIIALVAFYIVKDRFDDALKTCENHVKLEKHDKTELEILPTLMALRMIFGQTRQSKDLFNSFFKLLGNLLDDGKIKLSDENIRNLQTNAYIKGATSHMQMGNKEEAFPLFDKAEQSDPDNCDTYFHRGQLRLVADDLDGALKDFDKAAQLQPDHYMAIIQRDYAAYKVAGKSQSPLQLNESIRKMEETFKKMPELSEAYALMGQVYAEREDLDASEDMFKNAIRLCGQKNGNYYVHYGLLKLGQQKVEEAMKLLKKATDVDPHCGFAWETLGTIFVQKGELALSIEYFDRALNLAKTELEATHTFGMRMAAQAQFDALRALGVPAEQMQQMNPFA